MSWENCIKKQENEEIHSRIRRQGVCQLII